MFLLKSSIFPVLVRDFTKAKSIHGNDITQAGRSQRSFLSHFLNKGRELRDELGVALRARMTKCSFTTYCPLHWVRFCRLSWLTAKACQGPLVCDHVCQSHQMHFRQLPKEYQPFWDLTDDSLAVHFHQQSPLSNLSAPSHGTFWLGFQISET